MLFRNQVKGVNTMEKINILVFLPMVIAVVLACTACTATKGSIVINEKPFGAKFFISLNDWSAQNKCEMSLGEGDEIQVKISREFGKISLTIRGKNGSEPYTGNDLNTGTFTIKVPEESEYVFLIKGENASGSIEIKNLSR